MATPSTPGEDRDARAADAAEAALAAIGLGLGPRAGRRAETDAGERAPRPAAGATTTGAAVDAVAPASAGRRRGRGRPPVSDPQTVEEAAAELFLEFGYAHTNVDDIARRAGVSRSTFFNYFEGKPDVLWGGIDAHVDGFERALEAERSELEGRAGEGSPATGAPLAPWIVASVRRALLAAADRVPAASIPWAVAHADVMGTREELATTGMRRILRVESLVCAHIAALEWMAGPAAPGSDASRSAATPAGAVPGADIARRSFAAALTGAVRAGAAAWIAAGTTRRPLRDYLDAAVAPVCRGFEAPGAARAADAGADQPPQ